MDMASYSARSSNWEPTLNAAQRDALNIAWGQDQLEQSSWSNPAIVERVAADKKFVFPKPNEVEIVAR